MPGPRQLPDVRKRLRDIRGILELKASLTLDQTIAEIASRSRAYSGVSGGQPWTSPLKAVTRVRILLGCQVVGSKPRAVRNAAELNTAFLCVRPLQLHVVTSDGFEVPRADIADLAVLVVIPSVSGYRVGD